MADPFETFANRSDDDTVFLAPRLDFTPGGTSDGEGHEADIESPFAEPERKTVPELMSPVRPAVDDRPRPPPLMVDAPPKRSEEPSGLVLSLDGRFEPSTSTDPAPDAAPPSERIHSSLKWSRGIGPAGERQVIAPAPDRMRDLDEAIAAGRETAPIRVGAPDDLPPVEPAPARLRVAAGATAEAGSAFLSGTRVAWATYSRFCRKAEIGLSHLGARWLARAWALACRAARELGRVGGIGLQQAARWSKAAAVVLGRSARSGARSAATHGIAFAWAAVSAAGAGLTWLFTASRRALAFSVAAIGRRLASRTGGAGPEAMAAKAPEASSPEMASDGMAKRAKVAASMPTASTATAATATASTKAAGADMSSDRVGDRARHRPANEAGEGAQAPDASSRWRSILFPRLPAPKWAYAGLVAASIAVLFLAFGPNPASAPAKAALTFPIPAKPGLQGSSAAQSALLALTAIHADGPPPLPFPFELKDPTDEMIAYVAARKEAGGFAGPESVLPAVGDIEGLGQFLRAAEIVGLERLLEPDAAYTILAPNDAAFGQLAPGEVDGLLDPAGHERLLTLLSHHILPGRLAFDDIAGTVAEHETLAGELVTIDATEVVRIGEAGMVEADLEADDSILHVIDRVLPVADP